MALGLVTSLFCQEIKGAIAPCAALTHR